MTNNKKLPSRDRGCKGKMAMSLRELPHLKAQELARKHGKDYGVYKCPWCNLYHLTTKLGNQHKYEPIEYQTNFYN